MIKEIDRLVRDVSHDEGYRISGYSYSIRHDTTWYDIKRDIEGQKSDETWWETTRSQHFLDAQGKFRAGYRIPQGRVLHLDSEEHMCFLQLRACADGAATFHLPHGQGQHVCTTCITCTTCTSCTTCTYCRLYDGTSRIDCAASEVEAVWDVAAMPAMPCCPQDASQKDVTIKVEKPDEQHEVGKTGEPEL